MFTIEVLNLEVKLGTQKAATARSAMEQLLLRDRGDRSSGSAAPPLPHRHIGASRNNEYLQTV